MLIDGEWLLTAQRAAVHLATATAVIADWHLGYDRVRRRHGEAVPLFSIEDSLRDLERLVREHGVRRLVIAGDLFEDGRDAGPVAEVMRFLESLPLQLTGLVLGNHDRELASFALPVASAGIVLGRWRVVHGDGRLPRGRVVQGHVHPCLRWSAVAAAPCYLVGPRRLVLPAFSADAAGVNVLRVPGWRDYRCCAIAGERVLDFGALRAAKALSGGLL